MIEGLLPIPIPVWISVRDRLPPLDKEVLVYTNGNIRVCSLIRPSHETADVVWEDDYGYWDDDEGIAAVSHWMPLPEPPNGDEV